MCKTFEQWIAVADVAVAEDSKVLQVNVYMKLIILLLTVQRQE